jgi:hypothetical protein
VRLTFGSDGPTPSRSSMNFATSARTWGLPRESCNMNDRHKHAKQQTAAWCALWQMLLLRSHLCRCCDNGMTVNHNNAGALSHCVCSPLQPNWRAMLL